MSLTTIKEISYASGFSISTVSKALNNHHEISKKTRALIHKKAEELDYFPNIFAKALRSKKTNTIALIVPKIDSFIYSKMVSQIQNEAFQNNYRLIILESNYCEQKELKCIQSVRGNRIDGLIVIKGINSEKSESLSLCNHDGYTFPLVYKEINEFEVNMNSNLISKECVRRLFLKIAELKQQ